MRVIVAVDPMGFTIGMAFLGVVGYVVWDYWRNRSGGKGPGNGAH